MEKLNLQLSIEEINTILRSLSTQPFNQVHEMIFNIQNQAQSQLPSAEETQSTPQASIQMNPTV